MTSSSSRARSEYTRSSVHSGKMNLTCRHLLDPHLSSPLAMAIRQAASTSASPSPLRSSAQLEGAHSATPGDAEDIYNIEKSVLLDIAFLHSIATHRPIGPHKHFNVIPILLNLDRTARQVGARIRDDEYTRGASGGEDEREGSLTRTIKKEETAEEDDTSKASIAFASLPIDSQVIWMRLAQLYDIGGLEELVSCSRAEDKVLLVKADQDRLCRRI
jgi:hypothetical protein